MLVARCQGGALRLLVELSVFLCLAPSAGAQTAWTDHDIGILATAGTSSRSGSTFTVSGAGYVIGGAADQLHFLDQQVTGDFDLTARLTSTLGGDPALLAGLMVRETLTADAAEAGLLFSPASGLVFQRRSTAGTNAVADPYIGGAIPLWLRLVRRGSAISAYRSTDGSSWTGAGTVTLALPDPIYVGLAVNSHRSSVVATGTFTDVTLTGSGSSTAAAGGTAWNSEDVGAPRVAGRSTVAQGVYSVDGAGTGIAGTGDQFQFLYQRFDGDAEVIARLANFAPAGDGSVAGIMIRDSLAATAAHAFVGATGAQRWVFRRRASGAGNSTDSTAASTGLPGWIRLVRQGSVVSASYSADGTRWTPLDSEVIALGTTAYAGIAVSSANFAIPAAAVLTDVIVRPPAADANDGTTGSGGAGTGSGALPLVNQPPTVSITSPSNDTVFRDIATLTVDAAASDPDGSVARVDFYAGQTLIGSDRTAPYSVAWSGMSAGTYVLTAVAVDNSGASVTSAPITVTARTLITTTPGTPFWLEFTPSVDHAADVSYYVLELHRDGDPVGGTPVVVQDLGKPATDGSDIVIDVSTTIATLPAGSYYAVVTAYGPEGAAASAPSPIFSK